MIRPHHFPPEILTEIRRLHRLRLGSRLMAATLIATGKVDGSLRTTIRRVQYAKRTLHLARLAPGPPSAHGPRRKTEAERAARVAREADAMHWADGTPHTPHAGGTR